MNHADALQVPPEFCAAPAVAALGGIIGRQVAIKVKTHADWYEHPVLWCMAIGRPSVGKSPALRLVTTILSRLDSDLQESHNTALREHHIEAEIQKHSARIAEKKVFAALSKGNTEEARQYLESSWQNASPPALPRLVVNDASIEKLGEILNENPNGLIAYRDELAGWLASMDKDGREMDRAFWLEAWNAIGRFIVDRIGRGTIVIQAPAVSIFGGVQPGKLEHYILAALKGGFGDDGLLQRFQLAIYPDIPSSWRYVDRPRDTNLDDRALETYQRLHGLNLSRLSVEGSNPPFLRFSKEAQTLYVEWYTKLMLRLREGNEPPHMESHLAKYPALAARLALTLHLADHDHGPVSAESLTKSLGWCEFLEPHARRIYSPAADDGISAAYLILSKKNKLPDGFTARHIYRNAWSGLSRTQTVAEGLSILIEHGHLIAWETDSPTKPKTQYSWTAKE